MKGKLALMTLAALASAGCIDLGPEPSCSTDADCGEGEVCRSDECVLVTGGGGPDLCADVDCSGQPAVSCNDWVCNPADGGCVLQPRADNTVCDDGDACSSGETCQSGACRGGTAQDCSALDSACTVGVCNPADGSCVATAANVGAQCDDGDVCTTGDTCALGRCAGTPLDCSDLDDVCNTGLCNSESGACEATPREEGRSCDDGDACTTGETCIAGSCTGGAAVDCSNADLGCVVGRCDSASGGCVGVADHTRCADQATACSDALCEPTAGTCVQIAARDGEQCDDGSLCTDGDVCAGGACVGNARDCSALDGECVVGQCDLGEGTCLAIARPADTPCDDAEPCTVDTTCNDTGSCGGVGRETPVENCPASLAGIVVERSPVGPGAAVVVHTRVNRALDLGASTVHLEHRGGQRIAMHTAGAPAEGFDYRWLAVAEDGAPDGDWDVVAALVDDLGAPLTRREASAVQFDFSPPALAVDGFRFSPAGPVGRDRLLRIEVTADEDLASAELIVNPARVFAGPERVNAQTLAWSRPIGAFDGAPPASWSLSVLLVDAFGNRSAAPLPLGSIDVDTVPPALTLVLDDPPGDRKQGDVVALTIQSDVPLAQPPEANFGLTTLIVTEDGENQWRATLTIDGTEGNEGEALTLEVNAEDIAGNPVTESRPGYRLDFTPPGIDQVQILPAVVAQGGAVSVQVFADEPLGQRPMLSVAPELAEQLEAPAVFGSAALWQLATTVEDGGDYTMTVTLYDMAGNAAEALEVGDGFNVLNSLPEIVNPAISPAVLGCGGELSLRFEVSEGIANAPIITLGGIPIGSAVFDGDAWTLDYTLDPCEGGGEQTIEAELVDVSGQRTTVTVGTVQVDLTPPNIESQSWARSDRIEFAIDVANNRVYLNAGATAELTLTVDSELGQAPTVSADIDGTPVPFTPLSAAHPVYRFSLMAAGDEVEGAAAVSVLLRDPQGNEAQWPAGSVVFDFEAPGPPDGLDLDLIVAEHHHDRTIVTGDFGAVEAFAALRIFDSPTANLDAGLDEVVAGGGGNFPPVILQQPLDAVWLRLIDLAGNFSIPYEVNVLRYVIRPQDAGDHAAAFQRLTFDEDGAVEVRPPGQVLAVDQIADPAPFGLAASTPFTAGSRPWVQRGRNPEGAVAETRLLAGAGAAWDHYRGVMVMFGGASASGRVDSTWTWDGRDWDRVAPLTRPERRDYGRLAFHTARNETILFGGRALAGPLDDMWAFDGAEWRRLDIEPRPPARYAHGMYFDGLRDRIVVTGGIGTGGTPLTDTWVFSQGEWSELSGTAPALAFAALAFNVESDQAVLTGGCSDAACSVMPQVTWTFENDSWTERAGARQIGERHGAVAVYDPERGVDGAVVVFGGVSTDGNFPEDLLYFDGADWVTIAQAAIAAGRWASAAAYNPLRSEVTVAGGFLDSGATVRSSETLVLQGARWVGADMQERPPRRFVHAMAFDPPNDSVLILSGADPDSGNRISDMWLWNGYRWFDRSVLADFGGFAARSTHTMVTETQLDRIVVFGGYVDASIFGDVWEWRGDTALGGTFTEVIAQPNPTNSGGGVRRDHAMAWDPLRQVMVAHDGLCSGGDECTETLSRTRGGPWTVLNDSATRPPWRNSHRMVFHAAAPDPHLLVYGGRLSDDDISEVWRLDVDALGGGTWTELTPVDGPAPDGRSLHAMAFARSSQSTLIFGGQDPPTSFGDTWEWADNQWRERFTPVAPTPRHGAAMVWDEAHDEVVLFGGTPSGGADETWTLDPRHTGVGFVLELDMSRVEGPLRSVVLRGVAGASGEGGENGVVVEAWDRSFGSTPGWLPCGGNDAPVDGPGNLEAICQGVVAGVDNERRLTLRVRARGPQPDGEPSLILGDLNVELMTFP